MNKLATIAVLAGALAAPAVNAALRVTIDTSPYKYGAGGEFSAKPFNGLELQVSPVNYSAATLQGYDAGTFPVFCLEEFEDVSTPGSYNVELSQAAKLGGGGAVGGQDPISKGTAYLITQFAAGTLSGYDFNNSGTVYQAGFTGRTAAAGLLQEAIWYLEDEKNTLNLLTSGTNPFVTIAVNQFTDLTGAKADDNGSTLARVMNLTTTGGEARQDMLVVVPEPGTYIAGALLGLPFLAGAVRRIRRNRAA